MKVFLDGDPKEISALVLAAQERQDSDGRINQGPVSDKLKETELIFFNA